MRGMSPVDHRSTPLSHSANAPTTRASAPLGSVRWADDPGPIAIATRRSFEVGAWLAGVLAALVLLILVIVATLS